MKGNPKIIELLNEVLAGELVAINQYFLHAKMCQDWGYLNLAKVVRAESIDEMRHAEELCDRILFLEGLPNLQRLDALHIGETVPEQLKSDLDLEYRAIKRLNEGLGLCRELGDHASEELLQRILVDEEKHTDWIETQLGLIDKVGEQLYLAQQLAQG
ncbi:MAG: bacterioferritin [Polyangiaceae bacterium]